MSRWMTLTSVVNCWRQGRSRFREQSAICGSHFAQCRKADPCILKWRRFRVYAQAIVGWANADLSPGCIVTSDGLGCFAGVTDAGCQHRPSSQVPQAQGLAGIQLDQHGFGQSQTSLGGAYHRVRFAKYGLATSARLFIGLTALPS